MSDFRVTVSLMGRAHGFNLAAELARAGHLDRLLCSQPAFRPRAWGVPPEQIEVHMAAEAARRLALRLGLQRRVPHFNWLFHELHDRLAARHLGGPGGRPDLVVAWAQTALHTLRRARQLGARAVLERGSTHMLYQQRLLDEEFARWGMARPPGPSPRANAKAVQEYEEADAIAVPSHWVRRSFLELGVPARKLIHVPYGVDLEEFRPRRPGTPGDRRRQSAPFRAVFAGALTLQKGIPYLLEAGRLAGVPLLLLGGVHPEVRPFMGRYEGGYQHLGHVPQHALRWYYTRGDVFVMPSVQEGLAMVLLQALACGLPVICTTNTGGEDVVQEGVTGFVVPPRRPDLMAQRLVQLRDDPELLRSMKRAARRSVERRTWGHYAADLLVEYRRLLDGLPPTVRPPGAWAVG